MRTTGFLAGLGVGIVTTSVFIGILAQAGAGDIISRNQTKFTVSESEENGIIGPIAVKLKAATVADVEEFSCRQHALKEGGHEFRCSGHWAEIHKDRESYKDAQAAAAMEETEEVKLFELK